MLYKWFLTALCSAFLIAAAHAEGPLSPIQYTWLEGEQYESINLPANGGDKAPVKTAGWGRTDFLSGAKWLHISLDADQVEKELPPDGAVIRYSFEVPEAGIYAVWDRIGYEWVRSPFAWRVDDGGWKTVSPDTPTTDLMSLATWTEVAWLNLGTARLTKPGKHTLEIRLTRTTDDKGKTARLLYASDALVVVRWEPGHTPFFPNGKYKPGETAPETEKPTVFTVPEPTGDAGTRTVVPLNGIWRIRRDDEDDLQHFQPVATPMMMTMPKAPANTYPAFYTNIPVPGDKNTLRPDLEFAHRIWYSTRITIPASVAGRSFVLTFPQNSLNTTVYVNNVLCGFNKNPFAPFSIDITKAIKPGQTNDVEIGIRDAWYGYSASPTDPMKLRRKFNIPREFAAKGFQDLAYPVWNSFQSGILATPILTVAGGAAYVSDVFCKPSVTNKRLDAEITLTAPTGTDVNGELRWEAIDDKTGQVARTFPSSPVIFRGGGTQVMQVMKVSAPWPDAKYWWPEPNPQLYRLRTTLVVGGKPVDVCETPFGFREWGWKGRFFTLNGQTWRLWGDLTQGDSPETWLKNYRAHNTRLMRLMGPAQNGGVSWLGLPYAKALDFFDRNGVVVRRSGPLDGEAIGYNALENDPDLQKLYNSPIKRELLLNSRDQFLQQVKGERNHPSIQIWSLENEFLYINCINLYADKMDLFEQEITRWSDDVLALDPTRPTMVDGGGATKANTLPVHGDHYVQGNLTAYPGRAYEPQTTGGGRGRWQWDLQRPRYIGEDFFASGIKPADYAAVGGESAFLGKTYARPAVAKMYRWLTEGYRWGGQSAWHLWLSENNGLPTMYHSQSPVAVFCREWDTAFPSGATVKRTLGLFNDGHNPAPLTLTRTLSIAGKTLQSLTSTHRVAPGTHENLAVTLPLPRIATPRAEGTWTLTLKQGNAEVFREVKRVSVLGGFSPSPNPSPRSVERGADTRQQKANSSLPISSKGAASGSPLPRSGGAVGGGGKTLLYDPQNTLAPHLRAQRLPFTLLPSLAALAQTNGKVLIVAKDALTPREAASPVLAAWASSGRVVLVLEQKNPLHGLGLPAAMEPGDADATARVAFLEDDTHPAFRGLRETDLQTWNGDRETIARAPYAKPTAGGRSLVQTGDELSRTALAEVPAGKGVLLLSQLLIGESLAANNAVARRLFTNLLDYATNYKRVVRPVRLVASDKSLLPAALSTSSVAFTPASDPLKALAKPGNIAVIEATPANLAALAQAKKQVDAFTHGGGWIVLNGLTPDGLAAYNRVVGWDHMIRPFRRERVSFPARKRPLTAGLSTADIALSSGQRINGWTQDEYAADDEFSFVVDYDNVAPFLLPPDLKYWGITNPENDKNPYNAVNGYTSEDFWTLAFMIWGGDANKKASFPFKFPKTEEIRRINWIGNPIYAPTTRLSLAFDGKNRVAFDTEPNGELQSFVVPPGHAGREILLTIEAFQQKRADLPLPGIDDVELIAARPAAFYKRVHPLLNVGGLMEYSDPTGGPGGIVLCNVKFQERESVPANAAKKRNILATLLRNLNAPVGGSGGVIVGASGLTYTPLDLSKQANQYRTERGWFGDPKYTFAALPTGRQTFGGVPFQIYDFPTSPVPTVVMLGGQGIPNNLAESVSGIPVNRRADALFFLHTARIDRPLTDDDRRRSRQFEVARYIVTYTDGQKVEIPVVQGADIGPYRVTGTPADLPHAPVAWTAPFAAAPGEASATYLLQWNNPRPQVPIATVGLEYGKDKGRAVPVLLGVTAASGK